MILLLHKFPPPTCRSAACLLFFKIQLGFNAHIQEIIFVIITVTVSSEL